MPFKIINRDGPARIGEFTVNKSNIITPNILHIHTNRFKAPEFSDIVIKKEGKITKKPFLNFEGKKLDMTVVKDALQLFNRPKNFVDFIIEQKKNLGQEKAIYTPAIATPSNLALLAYLGIDFFDSASAIIAARKKIMFFADGEYKIKNIIELPCNCPVCNKIKKKPSELNFEEILNHNYYQLSNELKQVRNSIKRGNLRNLVEKKVQSNPQHTTILRNFDHNYYEYAEQNTPITSNNTIIATSKDSFNRPEIKRFQERIISRYEKPKSAKILLLLPCSAKKPYSYSKSHKLFKQSINQISNPNIIHEVIITSPIGLVPRELELIHPAAYYDIPVTGVWDEDEKKMIKTLLKKYLEKNKYDKVIVHLPKEITSFIKDVLEKPSITCVDSPTSKKSLSKLKETLSVLVSDYQKVKTYDRLKQNVGCLASYQFGKKLSDMLMKDSNVKGKYPYYKIMDSKQQLGMITDSRGFISLTLQGGAKIADSKSYWVEIFGDFKLKGSLFAPGIKDADGKIRIGDEVFVLKEKKLAGVGVALMNGADMKQLNYGEAVKMRHRS